MIAFTGEAGISHGYEDRWDDDGILHYYGEGQSGDMQYAAGNRAVERHVEEGKKLEIALTVASDVCSQPTTCR